ncbi:MAG TPA: SDR family oxidoreductase [Sediminibacterium sp.]|nr:SDR family oxidoreductase [Sediminibacterium sp.]
MKNIIIAGAGKGIGLSLVKKISADYRVLAITRSQSEELEQTGVTVSYADLTANDWMNAVSLPEEIHGLVYLPGSIQLKPFTRFSENDFLADFRQNVLGAVSLIQQCLPALKRSKGASVILCSTVAAKTGMPFHSSIAVSKGGIEGLTRSLAAEYASNNIRFNAIAPSLTDTALAGSLLSSAEKREAAAKRHPLQRIGDPDEVAALISFLLSEAAGWITGQVIGIDGGIGNLR